MANISNFQPEQDLTVGAFVSHINEKRIAEVVGGFGKIGREEAGKLLQQDQALFKALKEVGKVRDFLGAPEHILGNQATKHGEIAEHIEVHIRNARSFLDQQRPAATFEGVGRTAPVDYMIDGVMVQSKFINGLSNSLDHVLDHMNKYSYFGRDGSYYHIPRDFHETAQKILKGVSVEGLSDRKLATIFQKISEIEARSGKSFNEVARPSLSGYKEVQKGVVFKTVDGHQEVLENRNEGLKEEIRSKAEADRKTVTSEHAPGWGEAAKTGAIGAGIGAGFGVGLCIYKKHKEGIPLNKYHYEDWKDVGVEFAKGGAKGGISGIAIYGITNFSNLSAPLASTFVSAAFGVGSLTKSYLNDEITLDEFSEQGQVLCFDCGIIALGATLGQGLIPIPIVGTLVGTFAAQALLSIAKDSFAEETKKLQEKYDLEFKSLLNRLDKSYRIAVQEIVERYDRFGGITEIAFDFEKNAIFRLGKSVQLAREHHVPESRILKNVPEVDAFILA